MATPIRSTKDVFLQGCTAVAERFTKLGFKYRKTRPRLAREHGNLIHELSFWSSRSNLPGRHVNFEVTAYVSCKVLRKWLKTLPPGLDLGTGAFAGGPIQFLIPSARNNWNLAIDTEKVVDDIIQTLESEVLAFFERYRTPESVRTMLVDGEADPAWVAQSVSFLIANNMRRDAAAMLERYLARDSETTAKVDDAVKTLRHRRDTSDGTDIGSLALLALHCDWTQEE